MALSARLRHTVTIQRAVLGARNERGIKAETWADLASIRAWVQPLARREVPEAGEGGAMRADLLMFCLPTDITEHDRVVYGGVTYSVTSVHNPAFKDHHLEVRLLRTSVV